MLKNPNHYKVARVFQDQEKTLLVNHLLNNWI
jgi:hypothetical protein